MKKILIIAITAISLVGCDEKRPQTIEVHTPDGYPDYEVQFLFEVDGVKMYRFYDGRKVYFTNKTGEAYYDYTTRNGKTITTQTQQTLCNDKVVLKESWVSDTTFMNDSTMCIMVHKNFEIVKD